MSEIAGRATRAFMANALKQLGIPDIEAIYDPSYKGRWMLAGVDVNKAMRSALQALREPTETMLQAAAPGEDHSNVWRAMIDAAIEE